MWLSIPMSVVSMHGRTGSRHMSRSSRSSSSSSSTVNAKVNVVTTRLYRMLMRECRCIEGAADSRQTNTAILLQPPLDPRDWGHARIVSSSSSSSSSSLLLNAHTPRSYLIWEFFERHRHRHPPANPAPGTTPVKRPPPGTVGNHHQHQHGHNGRDDECLMVTPAEIRDAIRQSFRRDRRDGNSAITTDDPTLLHSRAIDALHMLRAQVRISQRTAVTVDPERGVRVFATSRCVGKSIPSLSSPMLAQMKGRISHRFAYRIRIENMRSPSPTTNVPNEDESSSLSTSQGDGSPTDQPPQSQSQCKSSIQLLGRYWRIEEEGEHAQEPIHVKAPTTGAVGHLPVIHPGQIFEYTSGCELTTSTGHLSGSFYMADVHEDTESQMVGDDVAALFDEDQHFQVPVGPFRLIADNGTDVP